MTEYDHDHDESDPALDDELRRLFADHRLDLDPPVSRDAGSVDAIVSGARRRKRRRMALATTGGVLAMAAIVFAGAILSGIVHPLHRIEDRKSVV